jgi:anti-sigma factor RsiW
MIERYRRRALSASELLELDDHLATCADCRVQMAGSRELAAAWALLSAAPETGAAHLTYEQLAGYVDDALDGPEQGSVRQHLDQCPQCAAEARDLFAIKEQLAPAARPLEAAEPSVLLSWYTRMVETFRRPSVWLPAQAAAVAAVTALLLFSGQVRPLRARLGKQRAVLHAQREQLNVLQQSQGQLLAQNRSVEEARGRLAHQLPAIQTRVGHLEQQNAALRTRLDRERQRRLAAEREARAVRTQRPGSGGAAPAGTLLALNDGPAGHLLARDGTIYREVQGNASPPEVRIALLQQRLEWPPELRQLTGAAPVARGGGVIFKLLAPVATMVRSQRPEFRWAGVKGAGHYELILRDLTTRARVPTPSHLEGTSWQPSFPLERGHRYGWEVQAFQGTELLGTAPQWPDPVAWFQVLGEDANEALERQLAKYTASPLTKGVLYAKAGLRDEAELSFRLLLEANPHSLVVRKLLDSTRVLPVQASHGGKAR